MNLETSSRIFGGEFAGLRDRKRLSTQIERIRAWALARDSSRCAQRARISRQLSPILFPESSISAQLRNLEKTGAGRLRCKKEKRRRKGVPGAGSGVWEYRLRAMPAEISTLPARLENDEPIAKIRWPATFGELEAAGYSYTGTAKECSICGSRFLWWITPARKWMPLSVLEDSRLASHHAVCGNVRSARRVRAQSHTNSQPLQAALF